MIPPFEPEVRRDLRDRLEAIERVRRVLVDDDEPVLWMVCNATADQERIEKRALRALDEIGVDPEGVRIEILARGTDVDPGRARFENVDRQAGPGGSIRVDVTLGWRGESYTGEATSSVAGGVVELRTGAEAAVDALEALIGRSLELRLIGVKVIRAFDREFMVVSLYRTEDPTGHFVGSVLVSDDPLTAAVLAVLDAVNRMLGNYLASTD